MAQGIDLTLKQFVSFYIAEELFGIDIKLINEVNPNINITPIPLSDSYIRGYVNIRGQVVLVIDLSVIFGKTPGSVTDTSHIIIFKTIQDFFRLQATDLDLDLDVFGDKPVAILVDVIGDVVSVNPGEIETPTRNLKSAYARFVAGVVKLNEELLIIINPVRVLTYQKEKSPG